MKKDESNTIVFSSSSQYLSHFKHFVWCQVVPNCIKILLVFRCRHLVFAEYFGDSKPKCVDKCDVCKFPKMAKKNLDEFNALVNGEYRQYGGRTMVVTEGKFNENFDELYGEGRRGLSR